MRFISCIIVLLVLSYSSFSQEVLKISVIRDQDQSNVEFFNLVKEATYHLLEQNYNIEFTEHILNGDRSTQEIISEVYHGESDAVLSLGFLASNTLSALDEYKKPTVVGISLNRSNQESSGIPNYTYVQSPFSISQDLATFYAIYPFKKLGILVRKDIRLFVENYVKQNASGFDIEFISVSGDPTKDLENIDDQIDALYFLPNLFQSNEDQTLFINGINERKIPSFSLIGRDEVENGILASISPSEYLEVFAKRIAIDFMKIAEGQDPKDFPIQIDGVENDFVINVETMERIELFPPFDILSQASLINFINRSGEVFGIESAIATAIQNNLSYQIAQKNIDIQSKELDLSKSNLLPDVMANVNYVQIDGNSANLLKTANQLTPQREVDGNLTLTQLLYSQPALANVAIQKALLESEKAGLLADQLDLVLDVCNTYLRYLQAEANLNIQNTNVETTLQNLNIAKTKAKIGTISKADVLGFESQLSLNKSALNDAQTQVDQLKIQFNQLLNRPLEAKFVLEDVLESEELLFIQDERILSRINNHYDIRKFASFLIEYAYENAPELMQLDWNIQAQEKSLELNQKSIYHPQLVLQGNVDQTFGRYGIKAEDESFEALGLDPYQPTWNVAVNASLPIFQGGLRKNNIQKDKIVLEQLNTNKDFLRQSFATNIRLSLENLGNSYNDIQFNEQASKSSLEYLELVQDLYREGVSNIVTLLDAQTNAVSAQLGAVSAGYQFLIDALTIERLYNKMYLISDQTGRESFINDYLNYLTKKDNEK